MKGITWINKVVDFFFGMIWPSPVCISENSVNKNITLSFEVYSQFIPCRYDNKPYQFSEDLFPDRLIANTELDKIVQFE